MKRNKGKLKKTRYACNCAFSHDCLPHTLRLPGRRQHVQLRTPSKTQSTRAHGRCSVRSTSLSEPVNRSRAIPVMRGRQDMARHANVGGQPPDNNVSCASPPRSRPSLCSSLSRKEKPTRISLPTRSIFQQREGRRQHIQTHCPQRQDLARVCGCSVTVWAGRLGNELLMICSHELDGGVKTTPSVFQSSKSQCFLSTSIILNWSPKECVVVAVVSKWLEDAFAVRPLLGLLLSGTNVAIKLPSPGNSNLDGKC